MSEPISLDVLVHSAALYAKTGEDSFGNPTWSATAVNLTRVRVSRAKQTLVSSLGEAKSDKLTLIYDCVNSLPVGTNFAERDKIVYGGQTFFIREVYDPSGDASTPHHYRCALVGS
jgi:hypothetical protein